MREPGQDEDEASDNLVPFKAGKEKANGHPKVEAQTYAEFKEAAEADSALEWTLHPFLPPHGLVVLAGEQKSGKTLWASWLVSQVLHRGLRVLFVELEGSRGNLLERLDLFCRDEVDRLGLFIRWRAGDKLDGEGLVRLLALVEVHQPNLVVVDPLFRAMVGDENESKVLRPVVENLEALSTLARCPVVVLHHVRKAPKEGRDAITSSDVRGSSALLGAASVVAIVHKRERSGDGTARFDVECADSWYAPFPKQRCLVTFGAPTAEEAMSYVEADEEANPAAERQAKLRHDILNAITKAHPDALSTRAVARLISGNTRAIGEELVELVETGRLVRSPGARRSWLYSLPPTQPNTPTPPKPTVAKPQQPTLQASVLPVAEQHPEALGNADRTSASVSVFPSPPLGGVTETLQQSGPTSVALPGPAAEAESKPNLIPLAICVKVVKGVRCQEPIHPPGVWCLPHKRELLGVAPSAAPDTAPPEAAPSPRLALEFRDGPVPVPEVDVVAREELGRGPALVSAPSATPRPVSSWEDIE